MTSSTTLREIVGKWSRIDSPEVAFGGGTKGGIAVGSAAGDGVGVLVDAKRSISIANCWSKRTTELLVLPEGPPASDICVERVGDA